MKVDLVMRSTFILMTALLLVACENEEEVDEINDVQYYKDNPEEREIMREECKNNPRELMDTPNCMNANEAYREEFIQELKEEAKSDQ